MVTPQSEAKAIFQAVKNKVEYCEICHKNLIRAMTDSPPFGVCKHTRKHNELIKSPITGEPYEFCGNCNHIKQAHFSEGREHGCSNADNYPEMCKCSGWRKKQNETNKNSLR